MKKRELRRVLDDTRLAVEVWRERVEEAQRQRNDVLEAAHLAAKASEERITRLESELQTAQQSARKTRELGIAGLLVMADALGVRVAQDDPAIGDGGQEGRRVGSRIGLGRVDERRSGRCEECGIVGGHKTSCSQQFARIVDQDRDEDSEYATEESARATAIRERADARAVADDREQRRGGGLAVTEEGE